MRSYMLDSNIIIDVLTENPVWSVWSSEQIAAAANSGRIFINPIIFAEIGVGFKRFEDLSEALKAFEMIEIPAEALFLAGKAFHAYRKKNPGARSFLLPDFFIGAHASILGLTLITRDKRRYSHYFPELKLILPR